MSPGTGHRNAVTLRLPGNLNAAIASATGVYIANLHDADEFDATLIEKWEAALDQYPSAGFVFCGVRTRHAEAGAARAITESRLNRSTIVRRVDGETLYLHDVDPLTPGRDFFERHFLHATYSIVWGTVMARRSALPAAAAVRPRVSVRGGRRHVHADVRPVRRGIRPGSAPISGRQFHGLAGLQLAAQRTQPPKESACS